MNQRIQAIVQNRFRSSLFHQYQHEDYRLNLILLIIISSDISKNQVAAQRKI